MTLLLVRGRGGSSSTEGDAGWTGDDVAEMDPVEAYVQQLVAQGYPEDTARAYAQQYYAQAAQQQQQQCRRKADENGAVGGLRPPATLQKGLARH